MQNINLNDRKHQLWFFVNGPLLLLGVCKKQLTEEDPVVCTLPDSRSEIPSGDIQHIELTTKQCSELLKRWNQERNGNTYQITDNPTVYCSLFKVSEFAPLQIKATLVSDLMIHYRDDIADELYFGLSRLLREAKCNAPHTLTLNQYELSNALIAAYKKHGKDSWLSIARDIITEFEVK